MINMSTYFAAPTEPASCTAPAELANSTPSTESSLRTAPTESFSFTVPESLRYICACIFCEFDKILLQAAQGPKSFTENDQNKLQLEYDRFQHSAKMQEIFMPGISLESLGVLGEDTPSEGLGCVLAFFLRICE